MSFIMLQHSIFNTQYYSTKLRKHSFRFCLQLVGVGDGQCSLFHLLLVTCMSEMGAALEGNGAVDSLLTRGLGGLELLGWLLLQ